ncbi:MAG: hypothetical protein ACK5M3_05435 [Dysgonomonas sp.]
MDNLQQLIEQKAKEIIQKRIKIPIEEVSTKYETMYITSAILAVVEAVQSGIELAQRWKPFLEELPPVSDKRIIIMEVCGSKKYYNLTTIRDQYLLDCMIRGAQMAGTSTKYWRYVEI